MGRNGAGGKKCTMGMNTSKTFKKQDKACRAAAKKAAKARLKPTLVPAKKASKGKRKKRAERAAKISVKDALARGDVTVEELEKMGEKMEE